MSAKTAEQFRSLKVAWFSESNSLSKGILMISLSYVRKEKAYPMEKNRAEDIETWQDVGKTGAI